MESGAKKSKEREIRAEASEGSPSQGRGYVTSRVMCQGPEPMSPTAGEDRKARQL